MRARNIHPENVAKTLNSSTGDKNQSVPIWRCSRVPNTYKYIARIDKCKAISTK